MIFEQFKVPETRDDSGKVVQVYRHCQAGYWRASKRWCKKLPQDAVSKALIRFASNEAGLGPACVYGGPQGAIEQLKRLEKWFQVNFPIEKQASTGAENTGSCSNAKYRTLSMSTLVIPSFVELFARQPSEVLHEMQYFSKLHLGKEIINNGWPLLKKLHFGPSACALLKLAAKFILCAGAERIFLLQQQRPPHL